jgi:hypothetical protein
MRHRETSDELRARTGNAPRRMTPQREADLIESFGEEAGRRVAEEIRAQQGRAEKADKEWEREA